jgi:fructose-1,6-bisphosphatase I
MYKQTLTQFLINHLTDHPEQKDLVMIMSDLASIGKYLSHQINKAGVLDIFGKAGHQNATGDDVKKFDVLANEICIEYLRQTNHFAALASEEEAGIVNMHAFGESANYIIAFDPIDGSSNIDVNIPIGTIFSIHRLRDDVPRDAVEQFYQVGSEQVGAGYILYGTSTLLVMSFGDAVHEFTLDQGLGEFLLSREEMKIPAECGVYTVNEANIKYMRDSDAAYIAQLRDNPAHSARQVGSLVADFHRNLIRGGIYFYPELDKKGDGSFKGKLRLNHEVKALAYLVEHAGGAATDGKQMIADIVPTELHQRTPLMIGTKSVIKDYINYNQSQ